MKPPLTTLLSIAVACHASSPISTATEFDDLLASFGSLDTIAGTGSQKNTNGWIAGLFEGADPTSVELSNPHMCMADAFGRIYIADKESHSVLRISADGSSIETVAGTHAAGNGSDVDSPATALALSNPNGLFPLADGTTYILDLGNGKIRRLDAETGLIRTVVSDPGGFGAGRGLWVSHDESVIFYNGALTGVGSNQKVQRWTQASGISTFIALPGDLGNITVDPDGHLVATSRLQHQVYRASLDGTSFTTIAGNGSTSATVSGAVATATGMERVRGIAFRADGSYFLCTQKGGDVLFVDTAGIVHVFIFGDSSGNTNNGDGQPVSPPGEAKIAEPRAVSLAPNGDLLITTNDTGYIRVVRTASPPPPPSDLVATLSPSGDECILSFTPEWNAAYIIESSVDLSPGSWIPEAVSVTGQFPVPIRHDSSVVLFRVRAPR